MTRAENAARAAVLKAQGLNGIQIAERMGIARSYAYELLSDPEGNAARARKAKCGGHCIDCGAAVSYSTGGPAERCVDCANALRRKWTRENVIATLRRWNELHGRPPGAWQWTGTDWPSATSVIALFGTWNAAIAAAGFTPMVGGHKRIEFMELAA